MTAPRFGRSLYISIVLTSLSLFGCAAEESGSSGVNAPQDRFSYKGDIRPFVDPITVRAGQIKSFKVRVELNGNRALTETTSANYYFSGSAVKSGPDYEWTFQMDRAQQDGADFDPGPIPFIRAKFWIGSNGLRTGPNIITLPYFKKSDAESNKAETVLLSEFQHLQIDDVAVGRFKLGEKIRMAKFVHEIEKRMTGAANVRSSVSLRVKGLTVALGRTAMHAEYSGTFKKETSFRKVEANVRGFRLTDTDTGFPLHEAIRIEAQGTIGGKPIEAQISYFWIAWGIHFR